MSLGLMGRGLVGLGGGLREAAVAWADCCGKVVLRLLSFFFFFQKNKKMSKKKKKKNGR